MMAVFALVGCTSEGATPTTIVTLPQLQEQIAAFEAKLLTVENKANTAVQSSALTEIKTDLNSLKSQVAGITAGVSQSQLNTSINTALEAVNQSLAEITDRIVALETATPPVSNDVFTVSVQSATGGVHITTNAPEAVKGYFELTYVLTSDFTATGASVNDALIWLSTNPVLMLRTGVDVMPVYQLAYVGGDWRVMAVTFRTGETNISEGETSKTALYTLAPLYAGYWTVSFNESGTAPVSGGW